MTNMSYCRFQNTLADLRDCRDALAEINGIDDLSAEEARAAIRLARVAEEIIGDLRDMGALT